MHARTFMRAAKLRGIVDVAGFMAGVDEVGRGPLAGPVVAAAVILEERQTIRGLNDSKLLTPEERERLDREIRKRAVCFSVASASVDEIDTLNILRAALLAMRRAVEGLAQQTQIVLDDGASYRRLGVDELSQPRDQRIAPRRDLRHLRHDLRTAGRGRCGPARSCAGGADTRRARAAR